VDGQKCENEAFQNAENVIFLIEFSLSTKRKWPMSVAFSTSIGVA